MDEDKLEIALMIGVVILLWVLFAIGLLYSPRFRLIEYL